jgi:hypothetical protein
LDTWDILKIKDLEQGSLCGWGSDMKTNIKEYPELHQTGMISVENADLLKNGLLKADVGIRINNDGRIWLCVDGQAFIRFKPDIQKSQF